MQQSRDYCVLAYGTWHIVLSDIKLQVTIHESLHYLSNTYISRSLHLVHYLPPRPLTGCSGAETDPVVNSASAASRKHFHVILKNY